MQVALIGHGIALSKTPAMHEAEGQAQGLDYRYHLINTDEPKYADIALPELLSEVQAAGYRGVNITHPFKQQVLTYVDEQDPAVQRIGAANTIVFEGDRRIAYNTDYSGFKRAFSLNLEHEAHSRVLQLGAGGAGTAVALSLLDSGVEKLAVYDTSADRVKCLVDRYRALRPNADIYAHSFDDRYCLNEFDGVVNTTPVGMAGYPGTAIPLEGLSSRLWVADIVYFPLQTELLLKAKAVGCHCVGGGAMATYQAADAFQLFTGLVPDTLRFEQCFARLIAA